MVFGRALDVIEQMYRSDFDGCARDFVVVDLLYSSENVIIVLWVLMRSLLQGGGKSDELSFAYDRGEFHCLHMVAASRIVRQEQE